MRDALLGGVDFFNTSDRASLQPGDPWRDSIVEALRHASLVCVITSTRSVTRPWINFEAGAGWLVGATVIPCCIRGVGPSTLPAPLSHLQAISLSNPDDLRSLFVRVAREADLRPPDHVDYVLLGQIFERLGQASGGARDQEGSLAAFIRRAQLRPKAMAGQTAIGKAALEAHGAVTPIEARQLRGRVEPGVSIRLWLRPSGEKYSTLFNCFANDAIADTVLTLEEDTTCKIELECLGQIKTYTTDLDLSGDEDRGVSYVTAYLVTRFLSTPGDIE